MTKYMIEIQVGAQYFKLHAVNIGTVCRELPDVLAENCRESSPVTHVSTCTYLHVQCNLPHVDLQLLLPVL